MCKNKNSYYKSFDITKKSRLEKLNNEFSNPYGYNLECNNRCVIDLEYKATHTNQNIVKNKEYLGK